MRDVAWLARYPGASEQHYDQEPQGVGRKREADADQHGPGSAPPGREESVRQVDSQGGKDLTAAQGSAKRPKTLCKPYRETNQKGGENPNQLEGGEPVPWAAKTGLAEAVGFG